MGGLARFLREAIGIRMEHKRPCPDCARTGRQHRTIPVPGGANVAPITISRTCPTCKGSGQIMVGEQVTERGITRAWENGRLIGTARRELVGERRRR